MRNWRHSTSDDIEDLTNDYLTCGTKYADDELHLDEDE